MSNKLWIVLASLAVVGCQSGAPPAGTRYELRMAGVANAHYRTALLSVKTVKANAQGKALVVQVQPSARAMDLAAGDRSYLVGYLYLPRGVDQAELVATFDNFGGYERDDGSAGAIDSRTAPIHFTAELPNLQQHSHAVVELDLERSLVAKLRSDERLLLPSAVIGY